MFYLNDMCCLCLNNKLDLRKMNEVNYGKFSYYNKIIICIPQMIFTELSNEKCVCKPCCDFVDEIFRFRDMCLRNGYILKNYISKLRSVSHQHGDISVNLNDFQNYINKNDTEDLKDECVPPLESDQKSSPLKLNSVKNHKSGIHPKDTKSTNHKTLKNKGAIHLRNKNGNSVRNKTRNQLKNCGVNSSADVGNQSIFTEEQFCKFEELSTDLKKSKEDEEMNTSTSLPENQTKEVTIDNKKIKNQKEENDVTVENQNQIGMENYIQKTENEEKMDVEEEMKNVAVMKEEAVKENDTVNQNENDQVVMNNQIVMKENEPDEVMIKNPPDDEVRKENPVENLLKIVEIETKNEPNDVNDDPKTGTTLNSSPIIDTIGTKKIYKCQHCTKICSTSYNFIKHFKTHKKKMPFKCSVCKKCFIFSKDLVKHLKNHIKDETTK